MTYPHVLAMPLQFAVLTHPRFVVRLMGLIHIANEIEQARALPADREFGLRSWIEGYRDTDRGHEFDLYTAVEDDLGTAWLEKSTLLARRASTGKPASRGARQALRYEKPGESDQMSRADFDVPRSMGRRYGWLSGDLNPIHLADRGAKLFGFERAVAHGMWSMARTLAALGTGGARATGPGTRGVQVSALHALHRLARALAARWPPGVRPEGRGKRAATSRGLDAERLTGCFPD